MECPSCGVTNAPERHYCRECGARLGQPCPACLFYNAVEDKHCGGCGRRLTSGAAIPDAQLAALSPHVPGLAGGGDFARAEPTVPPGGSDGAGIGVPSVSQSEIDGLFENILDDDPEESTEDGA